jgi:hypothetical protein
MGSIFKIPAGIIYVVGGLWGLFICLGIITDALGFIGGAIAFFLLPFTLYFAPWYAAIAKGNWFPLLLVYGSGIAAAILYAIGAAIDKD